jgi:membrane associated rhomboid family serine protease
MHDDLTVTPRTLSQTAKAQATVLGGAVALMWIVFFASWLSGGHLLLLGIIPRTAIGLRGIFLAPFLHGSMAHLLSNTIPFLFLGWLVMLRDPNHFLPVTLYSMLASGLMAWLFGAPGSVHIGASGVIFGYLGFLMLAGWYSRNFASVALSILVTIFWGPLVLGVIPGTAGISWQAHLGGFLGGIAAAREYRSRAVSRR